MAHITLQNPSQPVADFSVNGAVITVAGAAVDCAAKQTDSQVIVNVMMDKTGTAKINAKNGAYLAQIFIPARQYQDQPIVDAAGNPVPDGLGNPTSNRVALPLDPNAIAVILWPTV